MKRQAVCLIVLLAFSPISALQAQHYDWIRTLRGTMESHVGKVVSDNDGNYYLCPNAALDLFLDSTAIYTTPSQGYMKTINCPMKMTPEGNVSWKKMIYGNCHTIPSAEPVIDNIFLQDDTTLALLTHLIFPTQPRNSLLDSLFFLDTLLFSEDTGFLPPHFFDSVARRSTIDIYTEMSTESGAVKKIHTIQRFFVDNTGNAFPKTNGLIDARSCYWDNIANDRLGNHIVLKNYLHSEIRQENTRALCYLVDNAHRIEIPALSGGDAGNVLLMKHSRDFDSIIAYRYIFGTIGREYSSTIGDMMVDSQGNTYVAMTIESPVSSLPMHMMLNGGDSISIDIKHVAEALLIKYDSFFHVQWVKQFKYPDWDISDCHMGCWMQQVAIDEDSNAVFAMGYISSFGGSNPFSGFMDDSLVNVYDGTILFRFRDDNGELVSLGRAEYIPPQDGDSLSYIVYNAGNIISGNGRIFSLTGFNHDFIWDDTVICTTETQYGYDMGVSVWNYSCGRIDYIGFNRCVQRDGGDTKLMYRDSVLTFVKSFVSGEYAWFGDTCIMANDDIGVLARYVDPSYAEPYGQPDVSVPRMPSSAFTFSLYPNPSRGDVTVRVGEPATVTVMDVSGRTVIAPTTVKSSFLIRRSSLPAGAYFVRCTAASGCHVAKLVLR